MSLLLLLHRLQVVPDRVELIFGLAVEGGVGRFAVGRVLRHFRAGCDTGGVVHPAIEPFATEAGTDVFEVNALHFKCSGGFGVTESVAGGAAKSFVGRKQVFANR